MGVRKDRSAPPKKMNYPAAELRGIKKNKDVIDQKIPLKMSFRLSLSMPSKVVIGGRIQFLMKRLWIPAQKTAGMTDKGVYD